LETRSIHPNAYITGLNHYFCRIGNLHSNHVWHRFFPKKSSWVTVISATEPAPGTVTTARFQRSGGEITIELKNFPSFRSEFDQPKIINNQDGSIMISIISSSAGFISNKSEQLTDLSLKIPSQLIPSKSRVIFLSGDYDQVFVSAVAP
jgi:hypothetical protein